MGFKMVVKPTQIKYEGLQQSIEGGLRIFNLVVEAAYMHKWLPPCPDHAPCIRDISFETERMDAFATYTLTHFVSPSIETGNDFRFLSGVIPTEKVSKPQYVVDIGSLWLSLHVGRLEFKKGLIKRAYECHIENNNRSGKNKINEEFPPGLFLQMVHRPSHAYGAVLVLTQGIPDLRRKIFVEPCPFENHYIPPEEKIFYWMNEQELETANDYFSELRRNKYTRINGKWNLGW